MQKIGCGFLVSALFHTFCIFLDLLKLADTSEYTNNEFTTMLNKEMQQFVKHVVN